MINGPEWRARQRRLGRCLHCNKTRAPGSDAYCEGHLLYFRLRRRKATGNQPWRKGRVGRPPLVSEEANIFFARRD